MRRAVAGLISLVAFGTLVACAAAPPLPPVDDGPPAHAVRVLSNGWHTSIVVSRTEAAATGLLPEAADFPDAVFLEFGWGDRKYYPAREKTLGMTLDAALNPTPAVMHMAGLGASPERIHAGSEVIRLALAKGAFRRLVGAIAGDFERPATGRAAPVSRGLYPGSNFYHARGSFHLFNTCNTWTARTLRAAGVDISPSGVVTADGLIERLRAATRAPADGPAATGQD